MFEKVKNPIQTQGGLITVQEKNNAFTSISGTKAVDGKTAFISSYSLSILDASSVKSVITVSTEIKSSYQFWLVATFRKKRCKLNSMHI
ncbi:hypothetical protein QNI22_19610 [Cytophagaceae bacterium BD1B2-1]|uniref:Uncharacterized protein n=1 Tax=Xanthocytophaga agilis TaxID=3048010 RepID=A0AAE3R2Z7_9BACT|nr:hypothetical protein [Xanthocytophaga agilis]